MCADPADYPWSSHGCNALGRNDSIAHPNLTCLGLGDARETRCTAYRALAMETLSKQDIEAIRLRLQRQHALGSDRFRATIEA
jgi:putative transposase